MLYGHYIYILLFRCRDRAKLFSGWEALDKNVLLLEPCAIILYVNNIKHSELLKKYAKTSCLYLTKIR